MDLTLRIGTHEFTDRDHHLRAQWGSLSRETWPPFNETFLDTTGEGDQKISIDGESFPSTFGTGTEDDYGYAYGHNRPFTRPYHAQTRVDGPASGGHISLNRWYVLDALSYATSIRFDQEMWHWMPCRPTWTHVVYWYAKPGTPGPRAIDRSAYSIELNLCMAPDYGRQRLSIDGYAPELHWMQPKLGVFDLREGENVLEVEAFEPNPAAIPKDLFGLDYIFLVRQ